MGFWDDVVKVAHDTERREGRDRKAAAPTAPAMSASLVREAAGLLTDRSGSGGLAGLVRQFESQGLGQLIGSWMGPGENLPISGAELQGVLGERRLAEAAQRLGLPPAAAASTLAAVLPAVVDRVTPNGALDDELLHQGLDWLERRPA
jgi:uncharacterized protein YidB (DUF937 family)